MKRMEYIVESIDGDYAQLRLLDGQTGEPGEECKLTARALLPPEIREGSRLVYEWMQYTIAE